MSTARALRHALQRPHTHAFAPARRKATCQSQLRRLTSAVEPNDTPEANTKSGDTNLTKKQLSTPHNKTPTLDKIFGKDPMKRAKELRVDMERASRELRQIYQRQCAFEKAVKGSYRVRTRVQGNAAREESGVHIESHRVILGERSIPNIWLRDHCQCSECMHNDTKQRLLDTFSIPRDIKIVSETFENDILTVEWSDGHKSTYPRTLLAQAFKSEEYKSVSRRGLASLTLWDASIAADPPKVHHNHAKKNNVLQILEKLRKHGFCYVDETPFDTPQATEEVLKRIAFIRETHYGSFYDFTADLASKDTAYTNIALDAHTDTTYFSDPAGLQAFHLLSHTDGSGGASLLVDGFKVADELLQTDREAYKTLSTVNIYAHASGNEGISILPYRGFPVLEHDTATGDLLLVRWNPSDRAGIELPIEQVETWYDAARKFSALLKKKENEYWEQLTPGRVLIFDNWRVMHGRSAFKGKRRICGGYINRDDWISKYKMLKEGKEGVDGIW